MIRKIIIILLAFYTLTSSLSSQNQTIKVNGSLLDQDAQPIIGATVLIKGTNKGTVTDIKGNYSIDAPLGSTLVFSFIGMKPREAIVTRTGLNPVGTRTIIPYNTHPVESKSQSQQNEETRKFEREYGERMARYNLYLTNNPTEEKYTYVTQSIDTVTDKQMRSLLRGYNNSLSKIRLTKIEINSSTSIYWTGRLPKLQTTFAQGRPENGTWEYGGPENGEIFSWGPKISNLEYDGLLNNYNTNGNYVWRGNGIGMQAKPFQSEELFQNGFSTKNDIGLFSILGKFNSSFLYTHINGKGYIPGMNNNSHSINAKINGLNLETWINYSQKTSNWQYEALQSRAFYSSLITPPTFDNRNRLSINEAAKNKQSIYTPTGTLRSFAPTMVDNPFYLMQTAQNPSSGKNLTGQINYKFRLSNNLHGKILGGVEWYNNVQLLSYGNETSQLPQSSFLKRTEEFSMIMEGGHFDYKFEKSWRYDLSFRLPFFASQSKHQIRSTNSYAQPDDFYRPSLNRNIFSTSPTISLNSDYYGFNLIAGGQYYHSSTTEHSQLSPFGGIAIKPLNLIDEIFFWNTKNELDFKLTLNYNQNIKEYDLNYHYGSGNSLRYNVSEFLSSLINEEIGVTPGIEPEKIKQLNGGIHLSVLNNRIISELQLYRNRTVNAIYPVFSNSHQLLTNVADITVKGWEESLSFIVGNFYQLQWKPTVTASAYKSKVQKLYHQNPIPVSGFNDVHTALVKGRPVGVIMGSSYMRNENGQLVIGSDGFPLVDPQIHEIADPNPKMLLGFTNTFNIHNLSFGFSVQAQFGGKVWNGTRATLDYYGVSSQTGNQRYTTDYIFEGVNQLGNVNNIQVAFASKEHPVGENRWVRYGVAGVTEDYIEDASNLVLKELKVTYTFHQKLTNALSLQGLAVTMAANNLATITGYKGVMPTGTLWGHNNGHSLDYFNMPMMRSFGFNVKVTF